MKIDGILDNLNIGTIFGISDKKKKNDDYKYHNFGSGLVDIYSHCALSFHCRLNMIEYFFLKKYVGNTITEFKLIDNGVMDSVELKENYTDLPKKFIDIISEYMNEYGNEDNYYVLSGLPIGFIKGECDVLLSGSNLVSIFELSPDEFFLKYFMSQTKNPSEYIINTEYGYVFTEDALAKIDYKNLSDYIANIFIKKFNNYLILELHELDFLGSAFNYNHFLKTTNSYTKNGDFKIDISSVSSPIGSIDLNEPVENMLELFEKIGNNLDKSLVYIEFIIESSFLDFFNLINANDINILTSMSPFRLLYKESINGNLVTYKNDAKYNQQISNIISNMGENYRTKTMTSVYKDEEGNISERKVLVDNHIEYDFISSGVSVKYSLKMNIDDLNKFIHINPVFKEQIIQLWTQLFNIIFKN